MHLSIHGVRIRYIAGVFRFCYYKLRKTQLVVPGACAIFLVGGSQLPDYVRRQTRYVRYYLYFRIREQIMGDYLS